VKDTYIEKNLLALSESAKNDHQNFEMLKVETVQALERLKEESEVIANKITDAGQHCVP